MARPGPVESAPGRSRAAGRGEDDARGEGGAHGHQRPTIPPSGPRRQDLRRPGYIPPMIRAVLFDAGHTLLEFDYALLTAQLVARGHDLDAARVREAERRA